MFENIKIVTNKFFTQGHERTLEAKKNILGSLIVKCLSIAISLIMVPITIHYVNTSQYGIWLTLSSVVAWISFFDIGFTQGFRNKFTEARANGDIELAKTYVSTTYFFITVIFLSLWIILLSVNYFIKWDRLINVVSLTNIQLVKLMAIILTFFCIQFIFKIINTVLIADQKPSLAAFNDFLGQAISLAIIFFITKFTAGNLLTLAFVVGLAPTIVLIAANIVLFNTKYADVKPSFSYIKKEYAKHIINLGAKFFVLQIAAVIQYQTTLFLIAHYFNTTQVTEYNIAYKYFAILQMVFAILLSPLWSGVTDAYTKRDFEWIKNAVKKYFKVFIIFVVIGIVMLLFSNYIYKIWIGEGVLNIRFTMSILCMIYVLVIMFSSIFVFVINGVGAIKIQFYSSIITPFLFVSLAIIQIKIYHLGVESVLIASILSNIFGVIIAPIQYHLIFNKKIKSQIWLK